MWPTLPKSKKGLLLGLLIGILFGLYSNFFSDCHSSVGGYVGECKNENFITTTLVLTEFFITFPLIFVSFLDKLGNTANGWIVVTSVYYILFFSISGYIVGYIAEKKRNKIAGKFTQNS